MYLTWKFWQFYPTNRGLADLFFEEPESKCFRHCRCRGLCCNVSTLLLLSRHSHRQYVSHWEWLLSHSSIYENRQHAGFSPEAAVCLILLEMITSKSVLFVIFYPWNALWKRKRFRQRVEIYMYHIFTLSEKTVLLTSPHLCLPTLFPIILGYKIFVKLNNSYCLKAPCEPCFQWKSGTHHCFSSSLPLPGALPPDRFPTPVLLNSLQFHAPQFSCLWMEGKEEVTTLCHRRFRRISVVIAV